MHRFLVFIVLILLFLFQSAALAATALLDSSGTEIVFDKPFSRIISLYPAHTENLASLGLDDEVVGIAVNDDYPARLLHKTRFSYREDPEKFIAARPDLVLVRPMIERSYPQLLAKLRQAGIVVVSLQPTSVAEIFDYWRNLGRLTGREQQAEKMVSSFGAELATVQAKIAGATAKGRKRVYFEAIHSKMKTFAAESIAMFVLEKAGGINVATDAVTVRETNIAFYGKERILAKADEIDVFLAQQGRMNPISVTEIVAEPGFQAIKAVRTREVHLVDESIVSRPTMRILDGVRRIGAMLYPELAGQLQLEGRDG